MRSENSKQARLEQVKENYALVRELIALKRAKNEKTFNKNQLIAIKAILDHARFTRKLCK